MASFLKADRKKPAECLSVREQATHQCRSSSKIRPAHVRPKKAKRNRCVWGWFANAASVDTSKIPRALGLVFTHPGILRRKGSVGL